MSRHFGRAPFHHVIDTENRSAGILKKPEGGRGHCVPFQTLAGYKVQTVLCKGIGRGAAMNFASAGIPVMKTSAETIDEALRQLESGELTHLAEDDLCASHDHGHDH
ncbi:MAG: NifB/NifX family molybdenum-iron cluster-binding protein, partial [Puniceicoccaceae bacterium]